MEPGGGLIPASYSFGGAVGSWPGAGAALCCAGKATRLFSLGPEVAAGAAAEEAELNIGGGSFQPRSVPNTVDCAGPGAEGAGSSDILTLTHSFLTFLLDDGFCLSSSVGGNNISLMNWNLDRNN